MKQIIPVLLIALFTAAGIAGATEPVEGRDYVLINPPVTTASEPGRVEVIDVFWYGCQHCFRFKPYMDSWAGAMPGEVDLVHLPAVFRPSWLVHAQAWYAAYDLGIADRLHGPLFEAIHVQGRRLGSERAIGRFVESLGLGIDANRFEEAMGTDEVKKRATAAAEMMARYGVEGTPAVVVAGKYLLSPTLSGGFESMITTLDALVAREIAGAR